MDAIGYGTIKVETEFCFLEIENVLYFLRIIANLISVKRLQKKGVTTAFSGLDSEKDEPFVVLVSRAYNRVGTTSKNIYISLYKLNGKTVPSKSMEDLVNDFYFLNITDTALAA